ncbi:MAG: stage II sporulation protein R [Clostridia bacterium]|nr:stage II sporulation protein R [Clostridia bacterium]
MKKFCISLFLIVIILLTVACGFESGEREESEYLRIHIRANSNGDEDQRIKYAVRDAVINYLTPIVADCRSKSEATEKINSKEKDIKYIADEILLKGGFKYSSTVAVLNEEFPTRIYEEVTLEGGYYDALIIGLGAAKGDNWWCVVYPPLCFTSGENVKYKSKILEIISEFKSRAKD